MRNQTNNLDEMDNIELRREVKELRSENSDLESMINDLQRKNEILTSEPCFVGTIIEIMDERVLFRKHGDNQEFINQNPKELELETGDRVILNDSLSIIEKIDQSQSDERTKTMEVNKDPDVKFEDIGGLNEEITRLKEVVKEPLVNSDKFDNLGIDPPSGVLLHGPPGTGKTLMAKAVAKESDATFLKLAASELARKYIGEGSRMVRDLFDLAEKDSPSIIFIDEIDAIASQRSNSKMEGNEEVQRTLMQLLSEMDGFTDRNDIRIIAATNRFDRLDDAILRPGRFDRIIEIPEPSDEGRKQIFQIHTRDMDISDDVDFDELVGMTEGVTGADIQAICTEAGIIAIRRDMDEVNHNCFKESTEKVIETSEETDIGRYVY